MCNITDEVLSIAVQSLPKTVPTWITISTAVLTPLIAFLVAYIAWQQYQINKQRLRHETYERRVAIYKYIQKFLSEIAANGQTSFNRCHEFYSEASEAVFLFDDSVMDFIENLYEKGIELSLRGEELYPSEKSQGVQGTERGIAAKRRGELVKWFVKQLTVSQNLFKNQIKIST